MLLNFAVVALYVVNLAIRNRTHDPFATKVAGLPFALSLVAIALLSVSGWLGGKMVYNDGVGVGRHRRRGRAGGPTPRETIVTDGTIGEADLAEGESLRLDINDTIAAVAKVDGKIYAFQEFCTHRFGPLSEGTFVADGQQVRCPWHGSCFDMRTGKVTEGPAKEDIRAFEVEQKDGQVRIRVTDEL
jgi:nitrite reductase/ring-hydroxylating ferredoxin subunit